MNIKLTATMAALLVAGGMSTFGQGYVLFVTEKNGVYDNFSGASQVAAGDVTSTFLWAPTGTADPLGAGSSSTATSAAGAWATIASMLSSGWSVAVNAATSNEVDVADNASGAFKGQSAYNGGVAFGLAGNYTPGASLEMVVIGWDNLTGAGTLEQAEDPQPVGWSGAFTYATGATSGSTVSTFGNSGEAPFGVASVPEPASLALAGLGGLSMLFLRRRKS